MSKRQSNSRSKGSASGTSVSMLKFSNTSMTSARATHARHSIDHGGNEAFVQRRRFFNSSTEFFPILGLMLMSLCRKVTNLCYLKRRLMFYSCLVVVGGVFHDFTPALPRALFFFLNLSRGHLFNWAFVKYGWAWNVCLLLPLLALSAHALKELKDIELDKIEKLIERFHERRTLRLQAHSSAQRASVSLGHDLYAFGPAQSSAKPAVSLQSLSNSGSQSPSQIVQQCKQQLLNSANQGKAIQAVTRIRQAVVNTIKVLWVSDVLRLVVCSAVYSVSIFTFRYILARTSKNVKIVNENAIAPTTNARSSSSQESLGFTHLQGLDISGHVFILVYSNLMFLEECNIMTGWEPLGDRLFDLSREFMNLEIMDRVWSVSAAESSRTANPAFMSTATATAFAPKAPMLSGWQVSAENRSLFLAWHTFHHHTTRLRVFFLLCTLLTLLWDLMLMQTALFYHSLVEKLVALVWAVVCWYLTYRVLFPLMCIEVRRPLLVQPLSDSTSYSNSTTTTQASTLGQPSTSRN